LGEFTVADKFVRRIVRPFAMPILAGALAAALIVLIGETLLSLFEAGQTELERKELWFGVALALAVLGIGAFLASRPPSDNPLDRPVAIGHRSMFEVVDDSVELDLRRGPVGTIDEIKVGDTLYARSGALARVLGMVPGGEEYGIRYRGFIHATGLSGASNELWIPVEAVSAVYPETNSAFLAIKGDETESFGWNRPPEHFSRTEPAPGPPKGL
jgi:hypothetical protein